MTTTSQVTISDDMKEFRRDRRADLIGKLKCDRSWYSQRSRLLQQLWIGLSIAGLIFSFGTSVLVASGALDTGNFIAKIVLTALPSLAALCGTIIMTFRLRETWELRELGRIEMDELILRAKFLSLETPDFDDQLRALSMARISLARQQASGFFASLRLEPTPAPKAGDKAA